MERKFERRYHVRRRADRKRAPSGRGRTAAAPDMIADTAPPADTERSDNERGDDDGMAAAQPEARAPRSSSGA